MKSIKRLLIFFAIIFCINATKSTDKKLKTNINTENLACINNHI